MAEIFSGAHSLPCKLQSTLDSWRKLQITQIKKYFAPVPLFKEKRLGIAFDSCSQIPLGLQAPDFFWSLFPSLSCSTCPFTLTYSHKLPSGKGALVLTITHQAEGKQSGLSVGVPSSNLSTPSIPKLLLTTLMCTCMFLLAYSCLHTTLTDSAIEMKDWWSGS